jgi:hypothetical protein
VGAGHNGIMLVPSCVNNRDLKKIDLSFSFVNSVIVVLLIIEVTTVTSIKTGHHQSF